MVVFECGDNGAARGAGKRRLAGRMLATVCATALVLGAQGARAQAPSPTQATPSTAQGTPQQLADAQVGTPTAPPETAEAAPSGEEITVTGTRIVRDGFNSPTPVSVISTEEINREAPANINEFVNTLPAVRGSSTPATTSGGLSTGNAGIASVNLRNLGAARTLVLLDGQRSVASNVNNNNVDVNTFPQALIERVEVVTGGASSAYGSDAVSGVVNFILDKKFKGLKGEYEYGVTTYGDGASNKASLTGGFDFGGGRGHVIASGEYFDQKGIQTIDRDWNNGGFFQIDNPNYSAAACTDNNPATACVNARLISTGIGSGNFTPGGLILGARNAAGSLVAATSLPATAQTALLNKYFGTIDPSSGLATVSTLAVGQRSGQWMIGGDYKYASSSHVGSATLLPSEQRRSGFGRASWEFAPWLNVFGQVSYNYYRGLSFYQATPSQTAYSGISVATTAGYEVKIDNPYLPTSIRDALTASNLQSVVVSSGNAGLPAQGSNFRREVYRYVAGADGEFTVLDRDFHWNGYYQRGIAKAHESLVNAWNYARMANATDAVRASDGTIKCRINADAITTNDDAACYALDRVGVGGMDPRAIAYVYGNGRQPTRDEKQQQDVAAISFSTNNLFSVWAGSVSLAFGVEYRKEKVTGSVDPFYAPILVPFTPTWRYGNFIVTSGQYNVKEAFVETVIPIIKGMDFNGAARVTDYSTSGRVETWKTGLTYQPIPDIRLRGTLSRDIRAPNIYELFAAGGGATNAVNRPTASGATTTVSDTLITNTVGNPNLQPEVAKTLGGGAVFTPTFLPGFAASVDYYNIKLKGAISSRGIQTIADLCYTKNDLAQCANVVLTAGGTASPTNPALDIASITVQPQNYVSLRSEGIDFEASYRRHIGPGVVQLRALANRAFKNQTNDGINVVTNSAGQNAGSLPKWTYRLSAAYNLDNGLSFQAIGRGISPGTYDNSYIVCTTDCPLSTTDNRTINRNRIPGAWYIDVNAGYKFEVAKVKSEVFIAIRNLFNKDPVLVANGPSGDNTEASPQTNRALFDVLGRVFRVGLRVAY